MTQMSQPITLLELPELKEGIFIERPNRYLAKVEVDGELETVHVHDPGRLKELLYPENPCYIKWAAAEKRKTDWDMILAKKGGEWILVHSGYHRYIAEAILNLETSPFGLLSGYQPEVKIGHSRLDFKLQTTSGNVVWVEVKGCSLSVDGLAKFPDAPTDRGRRHLEELMTIVQERKERAAVLLLILSEAESFEPNYETDPKFYRTFYEALASGVEVYPCNVVYDEEKRAFVYKGILSIEERRYE